MVDNLRDKIITEARTWVDTPFKHRGREKGVGIDCIGVIQESGRPFGVFDYQGAIKDEMFFSYSRLPKNDLIRKACNKYLIKILHSELKPADIILMSFSRKKHMDSHVALYTGENLIQALSRVGKCAEHEINNEWEGFYTGFYRYPGLINK